MSDELSDAQVDACVQTLRLAATLDPEDPRVKALEQAAAGLRKRARGQRRAKRRATRAAQDREVISQATMHKEREPAPRSDRSVGVLHSTRVCYVCKERFRLVHARYHTMCPECAALNEEMRVAGTDLTGRHALVTGGRIKIGEATALRLLRDGATVHISTRFPKDAERRYLAQPDADVWQDRLMIHGVDFLDIQGVERWCDHLNTLSGLDIVIHNAAQTVRRPDAYWRTLAAKELEAPYSTALTSTSLEYAPEHRDQYTKWLERCVSAPDEEGLFPVGKLDIEGQPLDLRELTSWRMVLEEVHPVEVMEVWVVNAFVPYLLNAKLKPSMLRSAHPDRYVVHVTATEGQFSYGNKSEHHPHLNMAKAALNMMTLTSAQAWVKEGISMCAVDTGWVSDGGTEIKRQAKRDQGWRPPLDVIDGASRIYQPIWEGVGHQKYRQGVLLKDYQVTTW